MTKSKRGFAAMSKEDRSRIASLGGKAVPAEKRSFSTDRDLAAKSGAKGGSVSPGNFAKDRKRARAAGRKGGLA